MDVTFGDLFQQYYKLHSLRKTKCPDNFRYFYKAHGCSWESRNVQSITKIEIQSWIDELAVTSGPYGANKVVESMSAVINWGIKRGYFQGVNPCKGIEKSPVKARDRFLLPAEISRFQKALASENQNIQDFFWLCLLTGARRGRIQAMRWDEMDIDLALWQFDNKNGDTHTVPLSSSALIILQRRKASLNKSVWVFPGEGKEGYFADPKSAWKRILIRAGLHNLRIHDLRRTVGSYLAIDGADLNLIGKVLGHKDMRSTLIYARLNLAPVREALTGVQNKWFGLSTN